VVDPPGAGVEVDGVEVDGVVDALEDGGVGVAEGALVVAVERLIELSALCIVPLLL
jgi:hypothetical protein